MPLQTQSPGRPNVDARHATTALVTELANRPFRFEFFQAVRLLGLVARQSAVTSGVEPRRPVGLDYAPVDEIVRFRALVSHSFPSGTISTFQASDEDPQAPRPSPPEMVVSFLGMIGPSGVLPQHYTRTVMDRVRRNDYAFRDFLDLFHHRLVSHFFRVWEKYHFPVSYETAALVSGRRGTDVFTQGLYSLIGFGTEQLKKRLELDDEGFLYYAGQFACYPRTVISLEALIGDYFDLPGRVLQFQGQWMALSENDQTAMPSPLHPDGRNNQLGITAVVGERVWGVESKFRVQLGPLCYDDFCRLTPMGDRLVPLGQFIRTYVGPELDFDVQLILRREDVPECQLRDDDAAPRLGWNTWICSLPMPDDAYDAVFISDGQPRRC